MVRVVIARHEPAPRRLKRMLAPVGRGKMGVTRYMATNDRAPRVA